MAQMSVDDLWKILVDCAGESDAGPLTDEGLDVLFDELGYDSLAVLETIARIAKLTGRTVADGLVAELQTPRALLDALSPCPGPDAETTVQPGVRRQR